jgi:transposase
MNFQVREVKTKTGRTAVQVISRPNRQLKIEKHIGTGRTPDEILLLKRQARRYIESKLRLQELPFNEVSPLNKLFENIEIRAIYHKFIYELMNKCYQKLGFIKLNNNLLKDLAIIRIIEPASKQKSVHLLNKYFGVSHSENKPYKELKYFNEIKDIASEIAINFAKEEFSFDFNIVFYDVTTLYFECFEEDELRKCGYSKDNKFNQPQIMIALIVDRTGFPIAYEIFEGNKFEGHTFIPTILKFRDKYRIDKLTVVADAAMLSQNNMDELNSKELKYIVGARLGNLPIETIEELSKELSAQDGKYFLLKTEKGLLVCDYSTKRAYKDRTDRKKQLLRADRELHHPSKSAKRPKFVKVINKISVELNQDLIRKAELLEGIKGYYTNLENTPPEIIISRYKDLWKIEKAFRIAKSDLEIRPIFHWKKSAIESHILIVFISLCITKYLEIKTNLSIKTIKTILWEIHDVEFYDRLADTAALKRMLINDQIKSILKNLTLCY